LSKKRVHFYILKGADSSDPPQKNSQPCTLTKMNLQALRIVLVQGEREKKKIGEKRGEKERREEREGEEREERGERRRGERREEREERGERGEGEERRESRIEGDERDERYERKKKRRKVNVYFHAHLGDI
jgi:hypothetical protein